MSKSYICAMQKDDEADLTNEDEGTEELYERLSSQWIKARNLCA
jgi:hypothetical protein